MITVKLMGGLGNQMFQYALGLTLSKKFSTKFNLDTFYLDARKNINENSVIRNFDLDVFTLNKDVFVFSGKRNWFLRSFNKILPYKFRSYYVEPHYQFDSTLLSIRKSNVILEGYWQSHKYFASIDSIVKEAFKFKFPIISESMDLFDEITSNNSVCLNVRRGDFLTDKTLGFKDEKYFKDAVRKLEQLVNSNLKYYIFSDDVEWCKNHLCFIENKFIVDHSHKGYKFSNYLQLMVGCRHFVIPNSSFAWWAAYLSAHKDKVVIAPKAWFADEDIDTSDLIPESWYRI
jgi:hypothetical protein